jgi:hypothetical protein
MKTADSSSNARYRPRIWFASAEECQEPDRRRRQAVWQDAYDRRKKRLAELLDTDLLPKIIVQNECWMLIESAAKGHPYRWVIRRAIEDFIGDIRWAVKEFYFRCFRHQSYSGHLMRVAGRTERGAGEPLLAPSAAMDKKSNDLPDSPPHAGSGPASPSELRLGGEMDTKTSLSPDFSVITDRRYRGLVGKCH